MPDSSYQKFSNNDTTQTPKDIKLTDNGDGTYSISTGLNGVTIEDGTLTVNVKELRTNMINETMHLETEIYTMFAVAPTAGDTTFTVVDATGFNIDDRIQIEDGITETNYPSILEINGNDITLNRPIDKTYNTTTDGIRKLIVNMAVDGSVTPMSFKVAPETTLADIHITRFLFNMTHGSAGDMGLFGDLDPLEKGVLLRAWYKRTNEYKTIALWKTNADIAIDMFDVKFDTRSSGGGTFGTSGRWTFTNAGVVAELQAGTPPDFLELLIQDDLTGLDSLTANFQGHSLD